jgi:hypothetical protein
MPKTTIFNPNFDWSNTLNGMGFITPALLCVELMTRRRSVPFSTSLILSALSWEICLLVYVPSFYYAGNKGLILASIGVIPDFFSKIFLIQYLMKRAELLKMINNKFVAYSKYISYVLMIFILGSSTSLLVDYWTNRTVATTDGSTTLYYIADLLIAMIDIIHLVLFFKAFNVLEGKVKNRLSSEFIIQKVVFWFAMIVCIHISASILLFSGVDPYLVNPTRVKLLDFL